MGMRSVVSSSGVRRLMEGGGRSTVSGLRYFTDGKGRILSEEERAKEAVYIQYVDEILLLMRERHLKFIQFYDLGDRIMDLNFYGNFLCRYNKLSEEATTPGGKKLEELLAEFEWDDDMIDYVRGKRPYPGAMDWREAKRITAVMNLEKKHFVTVEIKISEGVMNVYDCNIPVYGEFQFVIFMEGLLELFPKLLKQSGLMNHLPEKLLNERWAFEGRKQNLPKNETFAACGSYSLAFIEHLITDTSMITPKTLMNDNSVARMQEVWAAGVIFKSLEP